MHIEATTRAKQPPHLVASVADAPLHFQRRAATDCCSLPLWHAWRHARGGTRARAWTCPCAHAQARIPPVPRPREGAGALVLAIAATCQQPPVGMCLHRERAAPGPIPGRRLPPPSRLGEGHSVAPRARLAFTACITYLPHCVKPLFNLLLYLSICLHPPQQDTHSTHLRGWMGLASRERGARPATAVGAGAREAHPTPFPCYIQYITPLRIQYPSSATYTYP